MTPTREQLIEQAIQGHAGTRMAMHWLFNQAHSAGRAQGLREAREVCEQNAKRWPDLRGFYVANECAAAIQQLEGK